MQLEELITSTREALEVQHASGEPDERDGVTIITRARARVRR